MCRRSTPGPSREASHDSLRPWRDISTSPPTRVCWRIATGTTGRRSIRRSSCSTASKARASRTTWAAWRTRRGRAGWNVVRLNQRNCGDTEHLSRGLYHSGLTHDPLLRHARADRTRRHPRDRGRRLLARRQPDAEARRRARRCRSAAAQGGLRRVADDGPGGVREGAGAASRTSPTSGTSSGGSRRACGGRRRSFPATSRSSRCGRVWTVRQFDEAYTAPHHGFRDAADYYHRASAHAGDRSHPRAGADPHGRGRSVRAGRTVSRSGSERAIRTSRRRDHAARRPLRVRRARARRVRRLLGGSARSSGSLRAHAAVPSASARTPAPSLPLRA